MNILHSIPALDKKGNLNVIIEIPKGSKNKYELDKETGLIKLDRVMRSGQDYPFDYGFVPQTHWHDGDPLDVVVLTTYPLAPGILLTVRPFAVLQMTDQGESDAKILAVPTEDHRFKSVVDLASAPQHFANEVKHFMETYKSIENKIVTIDAIEDVPRAHEVIKEAMELYSKLEK